MKNRKPVGWVPEGVTQRFYSWLVIGQRFDLESHQLYYQVRCDCGVECEVLAFNVRKGKSRRCRFCSSKIAVAASLSSRASNKDRL